MGVCQGHKMDKNIPEIKKAFVKNNCGVFLSFSLIQWKNERVGEKREKNVKILFSFIKDLPILENFP